MQDNDPAPAAAQIMATLRIYPYMPGGYGSSIGAYLNGRGPLGPVGEPPQTRFVEGSGLEINTINPVDVTYFDYVDELVRAEPAEALDHEIAGHLAAIGIVKGRPFAPDRRMRRLLEQAAAIGNATARTLMVDPRPEEDFGYYGHDSAWGNPLFVGGYQFLRPPPRITGHGVEQQPDTGARNMNARASFFYLDTGITPAMCMYLTGVGSQYLVAFHDTAGDPFDGARRYTLALPPDIPAERFWSLTVYDNQTRSMLQTDQRFPRAGSQSYPTPAATADPDGSCTVHFGPDQPADVQPGNWIQTVPGKGWFTILRLYSPRQPFFDKTWRPGEIAPVTR